MRNAEAREVPAAVEITTIVRIVISSVTRIVLTMIALIMLIMLIRLGRSLPHFRGNHLSNTTCLTPVFFKSDDECSKSW